MYLFLRLVIFFFISHPIIADEKIEKKYDLTRDVIKQQLQAFKINDADKAYSFAAPKIKLQFNNAKIFMEMVKDNYEPVSNSKDFYFLKSNFYNDQIYHQLQIISQSNQSYIATYSLILDGGEWKISGCIISPMEQPSI